MFHIWYATYLSVSGVSVDFQASFSQREGLSGTFLWLPKRPLLPSVPKDVDFYIIRTALMISTSTPGPSVRTPDLGPSEPTVHFMVSGPVTIIRLRILRPLTLSHHSWVIMQVSCWTLPDFLNCQTTAEIIDRRSGRQFSSLKCMPPEAKELFY